MMYQIEYDPNMDDIQKMVQLDKSVFRGDDVGQLDRCLSWQDKCKDTYTVLKYGDNVIGYVNFLAIKEETYQKIYSGNLKDYELKSDDVLPFQKGDNYGFFVSIAIQKDFQDSRAIIELLGGFEQKLSDLKNDGIYFKSIVADCVSNDGVKVIVNRFGGKYVCESKNGTKIYEFVI